MIRVPAVVAVRVTILFALIVSSCGDATAGAATRAGGKRSTPPLQRVVLTRPGDSVWMVATRHLPDQPCGHFDLELFRYQNGCWRTGDAQLFYESSDTTVVFAHGNRIESHEAGPLGLMTYEKIVAGRCRSSPIRFVIWSWPSDRIAGALRDARCKARRAHGEGFYLASCLESFDSHAPVSLLGFSYGGRVIVSALQHLAAETTAARPLVRPRVVLAAAAVSRFDVSTSGRYRCALSHIEHLTTHQQSP